MRVAAALVLAGLLIPLSAPAQKREMLEMNRDIALLQEELRAQKKSNDDRFNAIDAALKQILDQVNTANRQVISMDKGLQGRLDKGVVSQVTAVGAKVDTLGEDFRYVRENVGEISQKLSRLQQQVVDLNNAVRTMQAPPAPPPADANGPAGATSPGAAAVTSAPPSGVSAEGLYKDALRDKSAGNYDLALDEFRKYLGWFGQTDFAPNAQYYIGEIYYNQKGFDDALKAFDAVLAMAKNNKTADARFMKGRTLVRLGDKAEGAREFRQVVQDYPSSDVARRAQAELRDLGSTAAPATRKRR